MSALSIVQLTACVTTRAAAPLSDKRVALQVLRWVAYTACSRLAYLRGDSPLTYVPQSVCASDGTIMDVDIVLNEVCACAPGLRSSRVLWWG
jgi:hypothetical protein